ncbi:histone H3.v1-like [Crassostrea angulata]|uniref:histone H3.v1-like n=1 Tax=Magallana angulata TaxID=2784310 RepID=UPI00148A232F|nr:histone H3.v1-like [Crassostrea gigas]XP_052681164.1 histone H3.v1-like [Crassostrea angulata]XP_052693588.1 histone H3.v1-like [Crassostrea angulata]
MDRCICEEIREVINDLRRCIFIIDNFPCPFPIIHGKRTGSPDRITSTPLRNPDFVWGAGAAPPNAPAKNPQVIVISDDTLPSLHESWFETSTEIDSSITIAKEDEEKEENEEKEEKEKTEEEKEEEEEEEKKE